jgi:hypothetical protein
MARLEGLLGQRWKVETVNSVLKRKSGDTIRSRKPRLQPRELAVKVFTYNLHRLLQRFFFCAGFISLSFATEQLKPLVKKPVSESSDKD